MRNRRLWNNKDDKFQQDSSITTVSFSEWICTSDKKNEKWKKNKPVDLLPEKYQQMVMPDDTMYESSCSPSLGILRL